MRAISKTVGRNLKSIRLQKNITQGDICRALEIDRAYISALENGKRNPTVSTLERIAKVLGVSADELIK